MTRAAPPKRSNAWVAGQLRELAARLELADDPHRPRAYRRAADTIEQLGRPVAALREAEGPAGLDALPGIGPHIAKTVCELVDTGRSGALERLRKRVPVDVTGLLAVDGIGSKTLKRLWRELGVRSLEELEEALDDGRLRALPGFGARREERLQRAVRIQRRGGQRVPLGRAVEIARRLCAALEALPCVEACCVAGSVRRGAPTVGDIDLVAASDEPEAVAAALLARPEVESVYSRGPHRVSVRLAAGLDVDLRTVPAESFGAALLYFTGNRAHTLALRRLALAEGLKLNEYGLFRGRKRIAGRSEQEIYAALSLPSIPPEQRVGESEIRDALSSA